MVPERQEGAVPVPRQHAPVQVGLAAGDVAEARAQDGRVARSIGLKMALVNCGQDFPDFPAHALCCSIDLF